MKPKTLVLLAVAVGCGLVAMLGVQQVMTGHQAPAKAATTKVLVALENIDTGMRLTAENTIFKEMPVDSVQEDAVCEEKDFDQRAAKVPFMAGDTIRKSKLTEQGDWGKSIAIPRGMRVIAIPVDDTHTISGLLRPGDRVDVLVTYQGRGDRGGQVSKTKTLLEYVEVFATDNLTANKLEEKPNNNARAKNVALLLSPEQAGYVILAQRKGTLSLSWRRRGDDELAQTKDIDEKLMEELQGTVGLHDEERNLFGRRSNIINDDPDASETPGVSQFLDENATTTTTVSVPAGPVAPPVPKWTVNIYSGNSIVPQEFDIPESNPNKRTLPGPVPEQPEPAIPALKDLIRFQKTSPSLPAAGEPTITPTPPNESL